MTPNQFKNVLVFCALVGPESPDCLHHSPEYVIEKYFRYINAEPRDDESWRTGPHPEIEQYIAAYFKLWRLDEPGMMALLCREPYIDWPAVNAAIDSVVTPVAAQGERTK